MRHREKPKNKSPGNEEKGRLLQMLVYENDAYLQGYKKLAGIDEAGRGPLAGPVVAAACILPQGLLIEGVNDSKKLAPKARQRVFEVLTNHPGIVYGLGIVDAEEIDRINIYQATLLAMRLAVDQLEIAPDFLLVDGMKMDHPKIACRSIVKGDQLSLSIAAASIIAKETRDQLMADYHAKWPSYGFLQHKGYGTEQHREALDRCGPCPIHRRTFEPIKTLLACAK